LQSRVAVATGKLKPGDQLPTARQLALDLRVNGPGLFWVMPLFDRVSTWIDQRVITSFAAEQTLTSDTVPVNVDAVLFWMVYDAEKAALEVQQYMDAVSWAAQTALRDIIGRTPLTRAAPRPRKGSRKTCRR
jgi:regulator of protease activity HflC (stomatin/prohibitin superfamily)